MTKVPGNHHLSKLLALSVRQPWASLIVAGIKPVENRCWPTQHRGPLLIHAGQRTDREGLERIRELGIELELPLGGIVGQVDVVDCVEDSDSDWAIPGHWHWVLRDPRPLPFQPMRGRLGLFHV